MKAWQQAADRRQAGHEELAASVCEALKPLLDPAIDGRDRGLYLVTADAGIRRAVQFWADALAETPRFASPAGFPWTLANAPAGHIARELGILGPNHTLVGKEEALAAVVGHGISDLARATVREAVFVVLNLAAPIQAVVRIVDSSGVDVDGLAASLQAATGAGQPPR